MDVNGALATSNGHINCTNSVNYFDIMSVNSNACDPSNNEIWLVKRKCHEKIVETKKPLKVIISNVDVEMTTYLFFLLF